MNHVFYFDEIPRIPIRTYITSGLGGVTTDSKHNFIKLLNKDNFCKDDMFQLIKGETKHATWNFGFVTFLEEEPLGVIIGSFSNRDEPIIEIIGFCTNKDVYRGIGKCMINVLKYLTFNLYIKEKRIGAFPDKRYCITLTTVSNPQAQDFYANMGFVRLIGEYSRDYFWICSDISPDEIILLRTSLCIINPFTRGDIGRPLTVPIEKPLERDIDVILEKHKSILTIVHELNEIEKPEAGKLTKRINTKRKKRTNRKIYNLL